MFKSPEEVPSSGEEGERLSEPEPKPKKKRATKEEKEAAEQAVQKEIDEELEKASKVFAEAKASGKVPVIARAASAAEKTLRERAQAFYAGDVSLPLGPGSGVELLPGFRNNRTEMPQHWRNIGTDMALNSVLDDEFPMTVIGNPDDFAEGVLKTDAGPGEAVFAKWKDDKKTHRFHKVAGHHRFMGLTYGRELMAKKITALVKERHEIEEGKGEPGRTEAQVLAELEDAETRLARLKMYRVRVYRIGKLEWLSRARKLTCIRASRHAPGDSGLSRTERHGVSGGGEDARGDVEAGAGGHGVPRAERGGG